MQTASYLRFVADEDVVLHGVGDVVHSELQEGPLWDIDQTNTSPGRTAVQRVGPWDHCHSLKEQHEDMKTDDQLTSRTESLLFFLINI